MMDRAFEDLVKDRAVGVLSSIAYRRTLACETVAEEEARGAFGKGEGELSPLEVKRFEDYVVRRIVEKTAEYGLPLQFHTGIQAGSGNVLANSNPCHLNNLFLGLRPRKENPQGKHLQPLQT